MVILIMHLYICLFTFSHSSVSHSCSLLKQKSLNSVCLCPPLSTQFCVVSFGCFPDICQENKWRNRRVGLSTNTLIEFPEGLKLSDWKDPLSSPENSLKVGCFEVFFSLVCFNLYIWCTAVLMRCLVTIILLCQNFYFLSL